jgi:crotonobetainyl-CoA:carnitine CoA-transferase CaiB-like acyl-CoA transferase
LNGPFRGLRVLDLTNNVAGPSTAMILGDLGASIIKVEPPDRGDDGRHMGPRQGPWGAYFVPLNRGKRSLALDIREPEGRDIILRLAQQSDIFIENFRGGKAEELGLDEAAVRTVRPEIIYASLKAYGPRGPEYTKPGYDALLQARTGIISVTGSPGGGPARAGVSILDMGSGIWLAVGIITALYERERTGRGQRVDSSLFQTGVMWMSYHLLYSQFTGHDPVPHGTHHPAFVPYGDFPTADGTILIGVSNDQLFAKLCLAIERPEWAQDSRFTTNFNRRQNYAELNKLLASLLGMQSTATWQMKFDEYGVPASPLQTTSQLLNDPQLAAIEQLEDIELPGVKDGSVRIPQLPINLSLTPPSISGPPPQLGEHGRAILMEAGFSEEEIEAFVSRGIVQLHTT